MIRTLRRAALVAALLALWATAPALAQTVATERFTVLASAERTATTQSGTFRNQSNTGYLFVLDVTAVTDTPALTFVFQIQDVASGKWVDFMTAGTAVATVSTSVYIVRYDWEDTDTTTDITEILTHNAPLGVWRVQITHGDADAATYSVGAMAYK